jgi:hypothetical protein
VHLDAQNIAPAAWDRRAECLAAMSLRPASLPAAYNHPRVVVSARRRQRNGHHPPAHRRDLDIDASPISRNVSNNIAKLLNANKDLLLDVY